MLISFNSSVSFSISLIVIFVLPLPCICIGGWVKRKRVKGVANALYLIINICVNQHHLILHCQGCLCNLHVLLCLIICFTNCVIYFLRSFEGAGCLMIAVNVFLFNSDLKGYTRYTCIASEGTMWAANGAYNVAQSGGRQ
ncbi:hypothetical protein ACFX2I_005431 [Malus domestica]